MMLKHKRSRTWRLGLTVCILSLLLATALPVGSIAGGPIQPRDAPVVPQMSSIAGATFDTERGEVIIFGAADPALPPMSVDYVRENLVLALRAFADPRVFELPGVSFEGTEDPIAVVYFGGVENTHFGQVVCEADRLLKVYSLGRDNLTGEPVNSTVPGYLSLPDRIAQIPETTLAPIMTRYFYTPTLVAEEVTAPHTIVFSSTQQLVDWAYVSLETSVATTQSAQGFIDHFNDHYWDFAGERWSLHGDSTLYEIPQLARLTAIAKWIAEREIDLLLPGMTEHWLDDLPITWTQTPTQTTGIEVTWQQEVNGQTYQFTRRGGVYILGQLLFAWARQAAQNIANEVRDFVVSRAPADMTYYAAGRTAVAPLTQPAEAEGPLVAYAIPLADEALSNGDFEAGPGGPGWTHDSVLEVIRTEQPRNGAYGAIFPSYHNANILLQQEAYIPADATLARVTYNRAILTNETDPSQGHDHLTVSLTDPAGHVLANLETLDDRDADGYWHEVSFDVRELAGHSVQLRFQATTDAQNITMFYLDDVSLQYYDVIAPTVVGASCSKQASAGQTITCTLTFHEPMKTSAAPAVVAIHESSGAEYALAPCSELGYQNGYDLASPVSWHGTLLITTAMVGGTYHLQVSDAQDVAGNVMGEAQVARFDVQAGERHRAYLPVAIK